MIPNCKMRHENGNCLPAGGFCTANKNICEALQNAYEMGQQNVMWKAVKHGRWVPGRKIGKEILTDGTIAVTYEDYKCSSCGLILFRLLHNIDGTPFYKFCPNCGARMDGEENG